MAKITQNTVTEFFFGDRGALTPWSGELHPLGWRAFTPWGGEPSPPGVESLHPLGWRSFTPWGGKPLPPGVGSLHLEWSAR